MSESVISEPINLIDHPFIVKKGQTIKISIDNIPTALYTVPNNHHRYLFQIVAIPESLDMGHLNMILKEFREKGFISSVRMIAVTKRLEDKE